MKGAGLEAPRALLVGGGVESALVHHQPRLEEQRALFRKDGGIEDELDARKLGANLQPHHWGTVPMHEG